MIVEPESCIVIGRSKEPKYGMELGFPHLSKYLIVPLENIVGLEDARYMSIGEIPREIDKLGGTVTVKLWPEKDNPSNSPNNTSLWVSIKRSFNLK